MRNRGSAPEKSKVVLGTLWAILGAALFGGVPVFVRMLSDVGYSSFELVFYRGAIGLLVLSPYFLGSRAATLRTKVIGTHLKRGFFHISGMLLWFVGLASIPVTEAIAIHFTTPLFVVVLAIAILGERVGIRRWVATGVGFVGVLVILNPGGETVRLAAILVLVSAALYGAVTVYIKILARTESAFTVTVYSNVFLVVSMLPPTVYLFHAPGWSDLTALLGLGLCGSLAPLCLTRALKVAELSIIAPLDFLRLPFAAAFAFVFFAELPTAQTVIGAVIIFGSCYYITHREARLERQKSNA